MPLFLSLCIGKIFARYQPQINSKYALSFPIEIKPPPPRTPSSRIESIESMEKTTKKQFDEEPPPAIGVPYPQQAYYAAPNPHQPGLVPPNAVYGDPKGIPLIQTMFRDTPAPFNCACCGSSGLTVVRSKPSLAAVVGCMMPFMLGVCFLCPSMDCLWHKYHYCPNCQQKVADFEKSDPCLVVDPPRWTEESFAIPA